MLRCSRCQSSDVLRILRTPAFDRVFAIGGLWPYTCIACRWSFLATVSRVPAYRPEFHGRGVTPGSTTQSCSPSNEPRVLTSPSDTTSGLLALFNALRCPEGVVRDVAGVCAGAPDG
jgi:hypothetical protein